MMGLKFKIRHSNLGAAAMFAAFAVAPLTLQAADVVSTSTPAAPPPIARVVLPYQSVFADYQKLENFSEPKATAWRLANERVESVGGWREYARQASRADATATTSTTQPATPTATTPGAIAKPPAMLHQHGKKP